MKKTALLLGLVVAAWLIAGHWAWADEAAGTLEPMVVTATKTPKKLENLPAVATVIGQEEIEALPAKTVGDLLANLPGIYVTQPQGEGLVTPQSMTISGNGFPGNNLVLLDGQRINNPSTGYAYVSTMPVRAVARIEFLRGPYSALYGSSAGGGIVNIITKDGGKQGFVEPWGRLGDYGRHEWGVDSGVVLGDFSLGIFYDRKEVENYLLQTDQGIDTRNRTFDHNRLHVKLTGPLGGRTHAALSGGLVEGKTGSGVGNNLNHYNRQIISHYYTNLALESELSQSWALRARAGWRYAEHNYHGETLERVNWRVVGPPWNQIRIPSFIYKESLNDTRSHSYDLDVSASHTFMDDHILTFGSEVVYNTTQKKILDKSTGDLLAVQGRPGKSGSENDTQYSFYAQYNFVLAQKLEFLLGGRFDHYESYGSEFSPKATVSWNYLPGGHFKISAGKGFRAPNLNELYSVPWSISPFIVYQGNPNLGPETFWSYQASLEQRLADNSVFFRVTPYYTKAKGLITSVRHPDSFNPGGQVMQPENIAKVEIRGVDVELACTFHKSFTAFANYNYNETRDETTGQMLEGYPYNNAAVGLRFNQRMGADWRAYGSWAARYRSAWSSTSWGNPPVTDTVGEYWLHNAGLGIVFKEALTVDCEFFNIFNTRGKAGIDNRLPAVNYAVGVSYRYNF